MLTTSRVGCLRMLAFGKQLVMPCYLSQENQVSLPHPHRFTNIPRACWVPFHYVNFHIRGAGKKASPRRGLCSIVKMKKLRLPAQDLIDSFLPGGQLQQLEKPVINSLYYLHFLPHWFI